MNILTHNEARKYLAEGALPENFRERVELIAEFGGTIELSGLTKHEAECYLASNHGVLPYDFYHRVEASLREACENCGCEDGRDECGYDNCSNCLSIAIPRDRRQ